MAQTPWILPEDVQAYTDRISVKNRDAEKLAIDISRAEQYVKNYTHNSFNDTDYPELPTPVRTALILLAEAYAGASSAPSEDIKSETFDDYSYTRYGESGALKSTATLLEKLDLAPLLDPYLRAAGSISDGGDGESDEIINAKNPLFIRLRKL